MAATSGQVKALEPLLDAAERAPADSMEEPFEPTAGRTASRPVNLPAPTTLLRGYLAKLRGKLGAANRTEAVARARELSLIP